MNGEPNCPILHTKVEASGHCMRPFAQSKSGRCAIKVSAGIAGRHLRHRATDLLRGSATSHLLICSFEEFEEAARMGPGPHGPPGRFVVARCLQEFLLSLRQCGKSQVGEAKAGAMHLLEVTRPGLSRASDRHSYQMFRFLDR